MVVVVVVVAVVNFFFNVRKKAGSICSRMSAAHVHSTCADNRFALDAAVQQASYIASQDRLIVR